MAKVHFSIDPPPSPIPDFNDLSLGTSNATDPILQYDLKRGPNPQEAREFARLKEAYEQAGRRKIQEVLTTGDVSMETQEEKDAAAQAFLRTKMRHLSDDQFTWLWDSISRKEFSVAPYEIAGKNTLDHPYPGATAAMDGLWPGYDKPEYQEEYPFLNRYPEGERLHSFLREHRILFHMPETVARYGGVFVPHPYAGEELNIELRKHLETCDPLFHTAPKLDITTTKAEAELVLSYYEDDFVAVVEDEGGTVVGVVGRKDLQGHDDKERVRDFMSKDITYAPDGDLTAEQAFIYLETATKPYMLRLSKDHPPRIITQTTASLSYFLPPFVHNGGLGSLAYLRISDVEESKQTLQRIMDETEGVPGAIIETAHADTQYVRKVFAMFRQSFQDLFLMSGTVIDPYAVDEFMTQIRKAQDRGSFHDKGDPRTDADAMKIGIAEGHACRTATTGVRLTNAYAGLMTGAATWKEGTLMLDGWGGSDEFILGMSIHSVRMRQGGGAMMGRRESANPIMTKDGVRGKYYRGMAGADVQKAVLKGTRQRSLSKRAEEMAHLHSEGDEEFIPERYPSTVGRMMLMNKFLLQSAMSYAGVRKEIKENPLMQFQKRAEWYLVPRRSA